MKKTANTSNKNGKIESKQKKKYCKRKLEEEEEVSKIEPKVDKKTKFDEEPKQRWNIKKSNECIPKINNSMNTKCTSNLLHYFSKVTSDQVDKQSVKMAKFTVTAEIHSPQNVQTSSLYNMNKNKKSFKPKPYLNSTKLIEEYDKICVSQSESLISSHNDQKFDSLVPHTKPKWSMKVQLQRNFVPGTDLDDEIYTPTQSPSQLKENVKNCRTIPKILLPMKNKNVGWGKSLLIIDECKEDDRTNLITKIRTLKPQIQKNEAVKVESINDDLKNKITKNQDEKNVFKEEYATKLAPLFWKKLKSNPETLEKEKLLVHLEDSCPDSIHSLKFGPEMQNVLPFPKISHVDQITPNIEKMKARNDLLDETYIFSKNKSSDLLLNYSTTKSILKVKTNNGNDGEACDSIKADTSLTLSKLQTDTSNVQMLWKTISKLSGYGNLEPAVAKIKHKKKPIQSNDFLYINQLWTEKYKPRNSFEVLGNEEAVLKLKTWLQKWQLSQVNEDYSSSEEFHASDCLTNHFNSNQVAVLIGPHGTGKTASIYAVAQELGYTVLEVNASSRRPGKKILKEFEEATKSHGVKNFDLEKSLAGPLYKVDENDRNLKKSLIFMEDIDLIFEEDDGFVSATFQLATNTKRPIVMTLKNTCLHLPKIAPHQLRINFQPIVGKKMKNLLQLIALAETGYQLSQPCINALCQGGDLRKSLVQLQYLLLSGKERIYHSSLGVDSLSWKNMKYYIYKPAIKGEKKRKKRWFQDNEIISTVAEKLNNFALVSDLMQINDPTCTQSNLKCEPSTSLIQNTLPYSSLHGVNLEIGNWLNNSIKYSGICKEQTNQLIVDVEETECLLSKEQLSTNIDSVLSKIAISSDCQAISLDYLSSIRNICRAEETRNQLNSKRGNRFFHYLQNSKISSGTTKISNIFSAACKILE